MTRLPAIFVAHGAPTLALDARKGAPLAAWGATLPRPRGIVIVSAHGEAEPWTVWTPPAGRAQLHDYGGFADELRRVRWTPPPAPDQVVQAVVDRLRELGPVRRGERPLDHGVWTPLVHLAPAADVPVVQVALPLDRPLEDVVALGRALRPARDEGLLLVGSGGLVHALGEVDWTDSLPPPCWADDVDHALASALERLDVEALLAAPRLPGWSRAHPTDEHVRPALFVAGAAWPGEPVGFPVTGFEYGNLSRRCAQVGEADPVGPRLREPVGAVVAR